MFDFDGIPAAFLMILLVIVQQTWPWTIKIGLDYPPASCQTLMVNLQVFNGFYKVIVQQTGRWTITCTCVFLILLAENQCNSENRPFFPREKKVVF